MVPMYDVPTVHFIGRIAFYKRVGLAWSQIAPQLHKNTGTEDCRNYCKILTSEHVLFEFNNQIPYAAKIDQFARYFVSNVLKRHLNHYEMAALEGAYFFGDFVQAGYRAEAAAETSVEDWNGILDHIGDQQVAVSNEGQGVTTRSANQM